MTFGNPLMLLGALAALLPLLIHLFDRRRPRPQPFGAIAFVLRSQRRTASRLKLRRLLLYTLRTLILLAIPLALARPELRADAAATTTARGPAATSIVLDASLSMRFRDEDSHFAQARKEALAALRELDGEEPANLVVCGPEPLPPGAPSFDRAALRTRLEEAQPTFGPADMSGCLELAARSLEESPMAGKRLVVISDFTRNAFRLELPPPTVKGPEGEALRPEVVLRDFAREGELPNRAIVDLRVEPAMQAGPRAFQFTFTVRNFSSQPISDLEASLRVGDRVVAKGFVDLAPHGSAQKSLTYRFEEGGPVSGEVLLAPDSLPEDDRRAFVLHVPRELRALVVNGDPHTVRHRDESFFVETALGAPGSPVRPAVRDATAGLRERFEDYDLVFLLNVAAPTAEEAARLSAFVEQGGGLFVAMGDQVDPEAYNERLGALLPRPLRLVKTAARRDEQDAELRAARLSELSTEHPVLSPFGGRAAEGLSSARFYKYMLLEPEGPLGGGSTVLAAYEDGAPALATARRGKGRVALLTTTVDRDWADLAIRTSFLPLMQRFASFLARSLEERDGAQARVGGTIALLASASGATPAAVSAPSGARVPVEAEREGALNAGPLREPGVHRVLDASDRALPELAFPVLLDPSESDLERLELRTLSAYFGEETVSRSGDPSERPATPLWTWLLVAAAGAFFLEGVLLRK